MVPDMVPSTYWKPYQVQSEETMNSKLIHEACTTIRDATRCFQEKSLGKEDLAKIIASRIRCLERELKAMEEEIAQGII